jgi:cardiolipin synthase
VNLPNTITFARILLVPAIVWLIVSGAHGLALALFFAAGVSDAIDGFLAKRLNAQTRVGAYLDPMADKALLVSLYVTLGLQQRLDAWLVILVVSRDILIVGAVLLAALLGASLKIAPLFVSKINTTFQIILAGVALAVPIIALDLSKLVFGLSLLVAFSTVVSGFAYLRLWVDAVSASDSTGASAKSGSRER